MDHLETVIEGDEGAPVAVITHPHPLYGGNMHNNVVMAAAEAARDAGYRSLRFNFRGVGASQGSHDGLDGELEDLTTAINYSKAQLLIGYSFGAYIAAHYIQRHPLDCILIAPPNAMLAMPDVYVPMIVGRHDSFCNINQLNSNQLIIEPVADHFWVGQESLLQQHLLQIIKKAR